ncbi:MAG: RdgB/HAM1 family non-canonical purine NTP pyrophosphatase [Candidatus Marinimicrobia bacterium]|nr:RdgB/HAM1 family non-canonical purine NTP pyrophosphatase [Candidatus Neomarinimicrobiota bacterium]MDP6594031.1 RdgB/HAM1 family non-canonical purine NTP pyrophosphatase [Candidatus Neomarinimicrobiota bacterium]MDP6836720.1 RdgB/HAM1 family non-canonical purine NTP pyrophosphatase [Candidatus Neomarinimicrobiota bacterium]MDP6966345.1 RdgB/HAM1 family non-canonical purine NTP pyrophosphatase [Candidatus Neomarinimicrobiota bacterium]
MKVIIATRNVDKGAELKSLLEECGIEGETLNEFDADGTIPEIEETGVTLEENAFIKAREVHNLTNMPVIADDTGLEVDALDGAPGAYSARYAGDGCTYEDNVNKLIQSLNGIASERRSARFRTVACFVEKERELSAEGSVEGVIVENPTGEQGFGYDPVFYIPQLGKTYAELTKDEKNQYSHRGKAIRELTSRLA